MRDKEYLQGYAEGYTQAIQSLTEPLVKLEAWVPKKLIENLNNNPFAGMDSINCGLYPDPTPFEAIPITVVFVERKP